jgi:hypothetical protein
MGSARDELIRQYGGVPQSDRRKLERGEPLDDDACGFNPWQQPRKEEEEAAGEASDSDQTAQAFLEGLGVKYPDKA